MLEAVSEHLFKLPQAKYNILLYHENVVYFRPLRQLPDFNYLPQMITKRHKSARSTAYLVDKRNEDDGFPVLLLAVQILLELNRVEINHRGTGTRH